MTKKILITGASSGIGRSASLALAKEGHCVVAMGRSKERLDSLVLQGESLEGEIIAYPCDLLDYASIGDVIFEHSDIDVLINNAGVYQRTEWHMATADDFDLLFETNVKAPFLLCQQALQNWKSKNSNGLIIFNASTLGNKPAIHTGLYSASKAAMLSMSKSIAIDFAPRIRSVAILPGVVETPIHKTNSDAASAHWLSQIAKLHPLRRVGQPTDIAELIVWLCSENGQWITGSEFVIDGGISLVS